MPRQTPNEHQQPNNNELYDQSPPHPRQTTTRGRSTCTANALDIQQLPKSENEAPISRKDIAQA